MSVYEIYVDGKFMSSHEKESDTIKELHDLYKKYPSSTITSKLVVNERYSVDLILPDKKEMTQEDMVRYLLNEESDSKC